MSLRDKMTDVSEEQLYEKLKRKTKPNIRDVDLYKNNGKLYLVKKLIGDKNLDSEIKEKWNKLLNDIPYYQRLKKIVDPTNEILIKAKRDNKLNLIAELGIDTDIDAKIRKLWSVLFDGFLNEYETD